MKKGIVIDINATVDSIRKSIEEAQINSQTPLKSVVTGIAGNHVKSFNSTGAVAISSKEVEIEDKDAVLEMLGRFSEDLLTYQKAIRNNDLKFLEEQFSKSKEIRKIIEKIGQAGSFDPTEKN